MYHFNGNLIPIPQMIFQMDVEFKVKFLSNDQTSRSARSCCHNHFSRVFEVKIQRDWNRFFDNRNLLWIKNQHGIRTYREIQLYYSLVSKTSLSVAYETLNAWWSLDPRFAYLLSQRIRSSTSADQLETDGLQITRTSSRKIE